MHENEKNQVKESYSIQFALQKKKNEEKKMKKKNEKKKYFVKNK